VLSVDLDGAFLCPQRAAWRMIDQGRGGRLSITANAVAPGEIATPMRGQDDDDSRKRNSWASPRSVETSL
jgi:hypothetical protein